MENISYYGIPLVIDPNVAYVCITDDPTFTAPTGSPWQVIYDPWDAFPGRFKHMNANFGHSAT